MSASAPYRPGDYAMGFAGTPSLTIAVPPPRQAVSRGRAAAFANDSTIGMVQPVGAWNQAATTTTTTTTGGGAPAIDAVPAPLSREAINELFEHMELPPKSDWGPKLWYVMKLFAVALGDEPDFELRQWAAAFYRSLQRMMPCPRCCAHYTTFMQQQPVEEHMADSRQLLDWVKQVQHDVTQLIIREKAERSERSDTADSQPNPESGDSGARGTRGTRPTRPTPLQLRHEAIRRRAASNANVNADTNTNADGDADMVVAAAPDAPQATTDVAGGSAQPVSFDATQGMPLLRRLASKRNQQPQVHHLTATPAEYEPLQLSSVLPVIAEDAEDAAAEDATGSSHDMSTGSDSSEDMPAAKDEHVLRWTQDAAASRQQAVQSRHLVAHRRSQTSPTSRSMSLGSGHRQHQQQHHTGGIDLFKIRSARGVSGTPASHIVPQNKQQAAAMTRLAQSAKYFKRKCSC